MASQFRGGNSYKTQYKAYLIKGQWRKNKRRKLEKRMLKNEADSSALEEFEKGSKQYGRAKPGHKGWFPPQEAKLIRECGTDDPIKAEAAKVKLARLREIYTDKRPSAVRMKLAIPTPSPTTAKQLLDIGIINAKRYKTFKPSHRRVYGGRAVSNRR